MSYGPWNQPCYPPHMYWTPPPQMGGYPPQYPMSPVDPKSMEKAMKFMEKLEAKRLRKEEEAKKKSGDKDKKPESKYKINPVQLGAILFLSYPIVGPLYNYMILAMNKSAIEAMQALFR